MRTRRGFRALARWAAPLAIGMLAGAGGMHVLEAQTPSVKRIPLTKVDLTGVEGKEIYVTMLEAQPGSGFPAHIHYGDEIVYLIEGSMEGVIEESPKPLKDGEVLHIPREKVHSAKVTGSTVAKVLAVHIVDKGKPLAEPVKK